MCIASLPVWFESYTYEDAPQELMVHKFEMGHNITKATKNICWMKDEGTVDHSMITRWLKFYLGCKNFDDQVSPKLWILNKFYKP